MAIDDKQLDDVRVLLRDWSVARHLRYAFDNQCPVVPEVLVSVVEELQERRAKHVSREVKAMYARMQEIEKEHARLQGIVRALDLHHMGDSDYYFKRRPKGLDWANRPTPLEM